MDIEQVREKIVDYLYCKGCYELCAPEDARELLIACQLVADTILSIEIGGEVVGECDHKCLLPEQYCNYTGKITRPKTLRDAIE